MFAVLKTGGKQYRVAAGDVLRVEKLACEAGETVQFNDVMMIGGEDVTVGTPLISGAAVQADVIDQIRGEKLIHFVKRRRKHGSQRTKGHRQYLTLLRVTDILTSGGENSGVKVAVGAGSMTIAERNAADDAKVAGAKAAKAKNGKQGSAKPKVDAKPKVAAKPKAAAGTKADTKPKAAAGKSSAETDDGMSTSAKVAAAAGAVAAGAAVVAGAVAASRALSGDKPDNLLDAPRDGKADDLKKISGLGPKLEGMLHENGVFHFDQIAAWSADEVEHMDELLSFKGRIARDGWIEQAKTFAAEQE